MMLYYDNDINLANVIAIDCATYIAPDLSPLYVSGTRC